MNELSQELTIDSVWLYLQMCPVLLQINKEVRIAAVVLYSNDILSLIVANI